MAEEKAPNEDIEEAPSNADRMEGDASTPFQSNPNEVPHNAPENPPQPNEPDSKEDNDNK